MSKPNVKIGQHSLVPLAYVHWFNELNQRPVEGIRLNEENPGVPEDIRDNGWLVDQPALAYSLPFNKAKDQNGDKYVVDAARAIEQRKAMLAVWESNDETMPLADAMRRVWIDSKGKWIEPLYAANSAHQRGFTLPAILASKVAKTNGKFDPATFELPIVLKEYKTDLERIVDQSRENTSRTLRGVKDLSPIDLLNTCKQLLLAGGSENVCRKAIGAGAAQKYVGIIRADNEAPGVRLIARCKMDRPSADEYGYSPDGFVPITKIDKESIRKTVNEMEKATSAAKRNELLELYIQSLFAGPRAGGSTTLNRKYWENVKDNLTQEGSPLRAIATAHLSGTPLTEIFDQWPELAKADYTGSVVETKTNGRKKTAKA